MPRKRAKFATEFPYEVIYWLDADGPSGSDRARIDFDPTYLATGGFVVHEDEALVVLVWEIESIHRWKDSENNGWRKIPKGTIVHRERLRASLPITKEEEDAAGVGTANTGDSGADKGTPTRGEGSSGHVEGDPGTT